MQTGRKRKSALLPSEAAQTADAEAGALQPERRKLRSPASAEAATAEQPASSAPAALCTPPPKARMRRRAAAAPAAPTAQLVPLSSRVLSVTVAPAAAVPLPAWTCERLAAAAEHLRRVDSKLAPLVEEHGWPERLLPGPGVGSSAFTGLARTIVGQQLSWQVARVIFQRVQTACGACNEAALLEPEAVLGAPTGALRACGLSERKAAYILNLAGRFASGALSTARIAGMDDDALFAELSAIKGIGRWSVDMFAMFHCGRPDILPVGDLAVRKGFQTLYGLPAPPSVEQMEALAEPWRPYRSLGSFFMWKVPAAPRAPRTPKKAAKGGKAIAVAAAAAPASPASGGAVVTAVAAAVSS
ncbi:hypothetical protein WJX81_004760 [Elliptochloris bilobata]|uniref:HhH-GPD domain-containing protein n=1 Tax=Elliptochloris bilobata TaxID=381761 RepID=A0AAW1RHR4_9CHLO